MAWCTNMYRVLWSAIYSVHIWLMLIKSKRRKSQILHHVSFLQDTSCIQFHTNSKRLMKYYAYNRFKVITYNSTLVKMVMCIFSSPQKSRSTQLRCVIYLGQFALIWMNGDWSNISFCLHLYIMFVHLFDISSDVVPIFRCASISYNHVGHKQRQR